MKKVLFIGLVWPEPASSAAGVRMMQLLNLFQEKNWKITFASAAQNLEFSENLDKQGVYCQSILLNDSSFDEFVIKLNPQIVIFDRFISEEQFGWRVAKYCPNALRILDTEDLHCLRQARHEAIKKEKKFVLSDLFSDTAKRELASIYRCDLSLFVSSFEVNLVQQHFGISTELIHYLPIFSALKTSHILSFQQRKDFVFIGNFLHEPNWDAVLHLYQDIWPLIHAKLPEANMRVYGAYCLQKNYQLHNPKKHFYIMGRADNAFRVIEEAKVMLAPLRFGAGIKGKLLEAMQCGTPSITTAIGAEAMHESLPWNGSIEEDSQSFANAAIRYYQNESQWKEAQRNGFAIIKNRYQKETYATTFFEKIDHLLTHLEKHRAQNFIGAMLQYHTALSTQYKSKWIEAKNKTTL